MKIKHTEPYAPLRARAYPEVGEQLDAIVKMAAALKEQGFEMPSETIAWLNKCQAVKSKFSKRAPETEGEAIAHHPV